MATPKRRLLGTILGVAATVGVLIGCAVGGVRQVQEWGVDGEHRNAAIAIRAAEAARLTNGAVMVDVNPSLYIWNGETNTVTVDVTVGTCPTARGFFRTPARPASTQDVSELILFVPSASYNGNSAEVPVSDKGLYDKLMASALSHCVAGDTRLQPTHSG